MSRHMWKKQAMSLPLCSSRGGGQNAPQVYFPEKGGGGRIDTLPPTLVREGRVWFYSFLGDYSLQVEKKCLASPTRSSRARLSQCTWATGVFPGNFGKNGSTRLRHCSGDPDPFSRIWALIFPNLLSKEGYGG